MPSNNHLERLQQRAVILDGGEQKLAAALNRAFSGEELHIIAIACPLLETTQIPVAYGHMLRLQHQIISPDSKRAQTLAEILRSIQAPCEKAGIASKTHLLVSDLQPLLYAVSYILRSTQGRAGFETFLSLLNAIHQTEEATLVRQSYLHDVGYAKARDEQFSESPTETSKRTLQSALNIIAALNTQRSKCNRRNDLTKISTYPSHSQLIAGSMASKPSVTLVEPPSFLGVGFEDWSLEVDTVALFFQTLARLLAIDGINWNSDQNIEAYLEALYVYDMLTLTQQLSKDKPTIWLNMQDPNSKHIDVVKSAHSRAQQMHPKGELPFPVVISAR